MPGETVLQGQFVYPDGGKYDGDYAVVDGKPQKHGCGRFQDLHVVYDGEWRLDKMHGSGEFLGATGGRYKGALQFDQFCGDGVYTWPDGAQYTGLWKLNRMHGSGVYKNAQGIAWAGEFVNGLYFDGKVVVAVR